MAAARTETAQMVCLASCQLRCLSRAPSEPTDADPVYSSRSQREECARLNGMVEASGRERAERDYLSKQLAAVQAQARVADEKHNEEVAKMAATLARLQGALAAASCCCSPTPAGQRPPVQRPAMPLPAARACFTGADAASAAGASQPARHKRCEPVVGRRGMCRAFALHE